MLCVLSLFIYSLYYLQKLILPTSKIIIILILYINIASAPNLQMVMYNLHYNLCLTGLKNIQSS